MRLVILGAGGYGRTIGDIAQQSEKYSEILFLDDNSSDVSGKCSDYYRYIDANTELYPAFGDNELRMKWIEELKGNNAQLASLIHPTAYVSPTAVIGEGTMVLPNASVGTGVRIGTGCIINMNAAIDHGSLIEDGVHVCLNAVVKSGIIVKENTKVEAGIIIEKK